MKLIVGKILSGKRLEACRVVDTETLEVKIISYSCIQEDIMKGEKVKGLRTNTLYNYMKGVDKKVITKEKGKWNFGKVPSLNGKGELIDPDDAKYLSLYGWRGFAEAKKYCLFNYLGDQVFLDVDTFKEKVKAGEINGATIYPKTGNPLICCDLQNEIM